MTNDTACVRPMMLIDVDFPIQVVYNFFGVSRLIMNSSVSSLVFSNSRVLCLMYLLQFFSFLLCRLLCT